MHANCELRTANCELREHDESSSWNQSNTPNLFPVIRLQTVAKPNDTGWKPSAKPPCDANMPTADPRE